MLFDEVGEMHARTRQARVARHSATFNETTKPSNAVNRVLSHVTCDSRKHHDNSGDLVQSVIRLERFISPMMLKLINSGKNNSFHGIILWPFKRMLESKTLSTECRLFLVKFISYWLYGIINAFIQ